MSKQFSISIVKKRQKCHSFRLWHGSVVRGARYRSCWVLLALLGRLTGFIPMGCGGLWNSLRHCVLCPCVESAMLSTILISVQGSKGLLKNQKFCDLWQGKSYLNSFLLANSNVLSVVNLSSGWGITDKFNSRELNCSCFKTWYYQNNRIWRESLHAWGIFFHP